VTSNSGISKTFGFEVLRTNPQNPKTPLTTHKGRWGKKCKLYNMLLLVITFLLSLSGFLISAYQWLILRDLLEGCVEPMEFSENT